MRRKREVIWRTCRMRCKCQFLRSIWFWQWCFSIISQGTDFDTCRMRFDKIFGIWILKGLIWFFWSFELRAELQSWIWIRCHLRFQVGASFEWWTAVRAPQLRMSLRNVLIEASIKGCVEGYSRIKREVYLWILNCLKFAKNLAAFCRKFYKKPTNLKKSGIL